MSLSLQQPKTWCIWHKVCSAIQTLCWKFKQYIKIHYSTNVFYSHTTFFDKFAAIRYGKLAKYDYGNACSNMKHYGVANPPTYNMSNIPENLPLFLSYGGKDALSDVKDVQNLLNSLKFHDRDKLNVQFVKNFAHADFIIGVTANNIVYSQMMAFFQNHPWSSDIDLLSKIFDAIKFI